MRFVLATAGCIVFNDGKPVEVTAVVDVTRIVTETVIDEATATPERVASPTLRPTTTASTTPTPLPTASATSPPPTATAVVASPTAPATPPLIIILPPNLQISPTPASPTPSPTAPVTEIPSPAPTSELTAGDGNLTLGPLGLGATEITYPTEVNRDETATIELIIALSPEIASAVQTSGGPAPASGALDADEAEIANRALGADSQIEYETEFGRVIIYPVMGARLEGTGFDVIPNDTQIQDFDPAQQTRLIWTWTITARETGRKALLLTIFLPIEENNQLAVKRTRTLSSFTINIDVLASPTPLPTPTPTATPGGAARFVDNLLANPVLLAAIILLLAAGSGGLVYLYLSRSQQPPTLTEEPSPPRPLPTRSTSAADVFDTPAERQLYEIICSFSHQQTKTLSEVHMGIDYDDLGGPDLNQDGKARELVKTCAARGRLKELKAGLQREFPGQNIDYDDIIIPDEPSDAAGSGTG